MTTQLKVKPFPGMQKIAPANIEAHSTEQAFRDAQFALDLQLHDLRSEFICREGKIRQIAEITNGGAS